MIFFIFSKFIFQYHFIAFIATCVFKVLIPPLGTRFFNLRRCLLLVPEFQWRRKNPGKCVRIYCHTFCFFGFWDCEKKLKLLCTWWNAGVPDRFPRSCATSGAVHRRPPFRSHMSHLNCPRFEVAEVVGVKSAGPGACLHLRTSRSWKIEFRPWKCTQRLEKGREGRDKGQNFRRVWPGVMQMIDTCIWMFWCFVFGCFDVFCGFWMVTL